RQSSVPLQWTHKTLNDPYVDQYNDVYQGSWTGTTKVKGDIPILNDAGTIWQSHIPDNVILKENIEDYVDTSSTVSRDIQDIRARYSPVPSEDLPIFAARLA